MSKRKPLAKRKSINEDEGNYTSDSSVLIGYDVEETSVKLMEKKVPPIHHNTKLNYSIVDEESLRLRESTQYTKRDESYRKGRDS